MSVAASSNICLHSGVVLIDFFFFSSQGSLFSGLIVCLVISYWIAILCCGGLKFDFFPLSILELCSGDAVKLLGNNSMLLRLAAKLCWVEPAGLVQGRSWIKPGLLPDFVNKGAQTDAFALCVLGCFLLDQQS